MRNSVGTEFPNFKNLGLPDVHTSDEIGSFSNRATRVRRPMDRYNCLHPGYIIAEVAEAIMSGKRSEQNYSSKTDFETRR